MMTFKEYADAAGITYEAVRRMVKRRYSELEGHIVKQGRTQYLDDEAVKILKQHTQPNVVLEASTQATEIEALKEENKQLLQQIILLQQGREELLNKVHDLEINLLEEQHKYQLLEMKIPPEPDPEPESVDSEAAAVESEQSQESEKRSFWARLFGRKN